MSALWKLAWDGNSSAQARCRRNGSDVLEDLVFGAAAVVPVAAGIYVGRSKGRVTGIAVGVGLFVAMVLLLVLAGYGY